MIYGRRRSEHITDALHWLQAPERIHFKISVLAYKVLHGHASQPLGPLVRVADVPGRRALLLADTDLLEVPPVHHQQLRVTSHCCLHVECSTARSDVITNCVDLSPKSEIVSVS